MKLFFVALIAISLMAAPTITTETPLKWLQIKSSNDADFQAKSQAAANIGTLAILSSVLPYSIVVTNAGSTPITAITIRFDMTIKNKIVPRIFFYYGDESRPLLPVGASRIFSPSKSGNLLAGGAPPKSGWSGGVGGPGANIALEMADVVAADLIRISLDLVVAVDGRTAGPDRSHKIGQLKAQTKGYDDLRTGFLMRVDQGASDSDIIVWLNTTRAAQPSSGDLDTQIYIGFLSSLAQEWLTRVERGQKADLARELLTKTGDKVFSMTAMLQPGSLQ